ncbi:hypothetical protein GGR54DRAFT_636899 [Hypoxylon sp. NC1633]|nr:hypothetical protein GGR54DRAFT_636899 [Hypoxylon sp. NC1633]
MASVCASHHFSYLPRTLSVADPTSTSSILAQSSLHSNYFYSQKFHFLRGKSNIQLQATIPSYDINQLSPFHQVSKMASSLKATPKLTVYRGFPVKNAYVWSPFVSKLETRLRLAGLPYKIEQGSLGQAPRGKIPYISTPSSPDFLGDSTLIIKKLIQDGLISDLNGSLTPVQRAQDLALRGLLEDKLYFIQTHERWNDNYVTMRSTVMAAIPYPIQVVVGLLAHRGVMRTLYGQGTARWTPEERTALVRETWESVSAVLLESRSNRTGSDAPFWVLGGSAPTEVDATLYGFIAAGLVCHAAPETQSTVRSHPVLLDYASRIHDRYFPDYEKWSETEES